MKSLIEKIGKSIPSVARYIAKLVEIGLIERQGSKKTGGYYTKE